MIIGFSRYGQGGSGPALDYLTGYLVNGENRDPKPEVVRGDSNTVAELIDTLPFKYRYSSGVLSFAAEDRVTPEIQEDIINRFENTVFAGLPPDRRSIVWIKHGDKGRTELHFVVPRVDLGTRKALNIAPPTPASRFLLDTLRESINRRYGFRDPSDPAYAQAVSIPNHVAKLTSQAKRLGRSARTDIRQLIAESLEGQALAGTVNNRADVIRWLKQQGFSVSRQGLNYVTVVRPDTGERVRLKGNLFREHFSREDLIPRTIPYDPARLLALDRRLDELVEKRAAYHRARYEIKEQSSDSKIRQEFYNDRTGNPIAHAYPAVGNISSGARAEVWGNALRFKEAVECFRGSSRDLECARGRLGQTDRAFADTFDKAVMNGNQLIRLNDLAKVPGASFRSRIREQEDELELEL
jgi:hypothetical protein